MEFQEGVVMPLRTTSTWWGTVLDAPDGLTLAKFYARLLGWELFPDPPGGATAGVQRREEEAVAAASSEIARR